MGLSRFFAALRRCKRLEADLTATPLARVLGLLDLVFLGVGSTLGLGVYVLAGAVAKTVAGPAVVLSFAGAAIASTFAGLCYAEFAARVPKAGSAYVYSYVSVGEFLAFTIGWNLILEYVISTASMAKGTSNYVDSMINHTMSKALRKAAPINVSFLSAFPDIFAFCLVLVVTILLAIGVKESARMTNVLTSLNLITILTVICAGAPKCNLANWRINVKDLPPEYQSKAGAGGFMPWGFAGVMAGSAKCFFGYVGFDCLATTGEEAKNPTRNIPLAIIISLVIIFLAYFGMSTVLTLMWPYYLQDADAPLIHVFEELRMPAVKWVVTVGAVTAMGSNLVGSFFPLPRVIYCMAKDGLLCRPMDLIHPRTHTPVYATVASGTLAAILALIFNLDQLIDMLSIGTLLAYTIVATSVLVLRYEAYPLLEAGAPVGTAKPPAEPERCAALVQTFNCRRVKEPTTLSSTIAKVTCALVFVTAAALSGVATLRPGGAGAAVAALGAAMLALLCVLWLQPRMTIEHMNFAVPWVPLVPYLSVCINMYLIVQLDWQTWVRFVVWMVFGYIIYFCHGIRNSVLNRQPESPQST